MKGISQDFSDCRLHNCKYTKYQPIENCGLRACIESFMVLEIFKIGERKVNFFKRLDFIAEVHNSVEVWVTYTKYTISESKAGGGIVHSRYKSNIAMFFYYSRISSVLISGLDLLL